MKTLATGVLVFIALLPRVSATAQTIKLGTVAPDGSPWHMIARDTGEAWSKATGGKLKLRIYTGGAAGDEPDIVRKMRVGQFQAGMLTNQGLTKIVPDVQALQLPRLLATDDEVDYVRERVAAKLEAMFEAKGFKVVQWGEAGWVYFFTQKPVVHPDDLKPLRLFAWAGDDPGYIDAWKDAGYNPVPIALTEILTGLQTGLINAFVAPPISALAFQWFGLARNMTDLPWLPLIGATVVSRKVWQEIPETARPALLQSARDASERYKMDVRKLNVDSVEVMKKHGLTVHRVPPELRIEWERRARAGYKRFLGRVVSSELVAEVERLRDEHRAAKKSP